MRIVVALVAATTCTALMANCGRKSTPAPDPAAAPPAAAAAKDGAPQQVTPFCVLQLAVEQATPAPLQVSGLQDAFAAALPDALTTIKAVVAASRDGQPPTGAACGAEADPQGRVGVLVRFDHVLLSPSLKPVRPSEAARADHLHVAVMAHAERQGADGRAEIAQAHVSARVPMPARRANDLAAFVRIRLLRAASMAVTDALGQLWVRRMESGQIEALLDDRDPFKRAAAVREVGERGMVEARPKVETAALSSRRDLAVVAAAALGRLGDVASLPTLESCLDSPSPEVMDAAIVAISEIADPAARKALETAAKDHPMAWIRQRAKALLER